MTYLPKKAPRCRAVPLTADAAEQVAEIIAPAKLNSYIAFDSQRIVIIDSTIGTITAPMGYILVRVGDHVLHMDKEHFRSQFEDERIAIRRDLIAHIRQFAGDAALVTLAFMWIGEVFA